MNRLRELRIKAGMTLDQIEHETGVDRASFNNYELGKTEPPLSVCKKLAIYFHVTPQYLVG